MKHIIWVLILFPSLLFAQENPVMKIHADSVEYNNGIITYQGKDYTGVLEAFYPNGDKKVVARVLMGQYHGPLRTYYENGQTHMTLTFKQGELVKSMAVYFDNGELKLRADVGEQERNGGNKVTNISYAFYRQTSMERGFKGSARMQLITHQGLSAYSNGFLPCNEIAGFRLFDNRLKNNGKFLEDSREVMAP